MNDDHDPLWVALCCLAAVGLGLGVALTLASEHGSIAKSLAPLCVLPCAALGLARRVRRSGGNATQSFQEAFRRQPGRAPRRYSRAFAVYLLVAYALAVLVAVATYGLTPIVFALVLGQGVLTTFVVARTSWRTAGSSPMT